MPTLLLDDLPAVLSGPESSPPVPPSYQLVDPLDGHANIVRLVVAGRQLLLFTAFPARLRPRTVHHSFPLMTPGEQERLVVQRTFTLSEVRPRPYVGTEPLTTDVDLLFRRQTLLRLVTYFGPQCAYLSTSITPFYLVPWTLLHPFFDLIELYLADHHHIVQCLAPYRKDDGLTARQFWQARDFLPDPLIPARLCKTLRRPS